MSLNTKYQRIKSKTTAFEYRKPDTPPNHEKNIMFAVEKEKQLLEQNEQKMQEKGDLIFQQVSRDQRNTALDAKPA